MSTADRTWAARAKALAARWSAQRAWLVIAGLAVCCYSLGVVVYVESAPDLGLRSAFSPELKASPPPRAFRPANPGGAVPGNGDRVTRLGNIDIVSWPDLLAAPRNLRDRLAAAPPGPLPAWARRRATDGEELTLGPATFR